MSLLVSSRVLERGGNKTWLHGLRLQLCITIQSRIGSAVLAVRTLASLRNNSRSSISMVNILGIVIRLGWNAYWPYGGSRVVPVVFLFLDSLPFLDKSRLLSTVQLSQSLHTETIYAMLSSPCFLLFHYPDDDRS